MTVTRLLLLYMKTNTRKSEWRQTLNNSNRIRKLNAPPQTLNNNYYLTNSLHDTLPTEASKTQKVVLLYMFYSCLHNGQIKRNICIILYYLYTLLHTFIKGIRTLPYRHFLNCIKIRSTYYLYEMFQEKARKIG